MTVRTPELRAIARRRSLAVLAAVLVMAGCAAPGGQVSQIFSASEVPNPSASATPTPAASPTAQPTPTPFGAAAFTNPDDCTNTDGGYRVAYPDTWYSNAAVPNPLNPAARGIPACQLFAPSDFAVVYGSEIPSAVAIWVRVDQLPAGTTWNDRPFQGYRTLSDSETTAGGQPARVREIEVTERNITFFPGDRYTEYIVRLSGNRYLIAQTNSHQDYDASKLILARMMQTLEFTTP